MTTVQMFCTVADLLADTDKPGGSIEALYQSIKEASQFLQQEVGWFIPVTIARSLDGNGEVRLDIPPLLSLTSIVHDGTTLAATDYIKYPTERHWPNGPYSWLQVDPDASNLSIWRDELDVITLTGLWGLYNLSKDTGATVADDPQSNSQTTLKVSNGSKVSPGMLLKIESEQENVTGYGDPTTAVTTLNGAMTAAAETATLTNGALVNVGEIIRINFEQCKVTDKQTHDVALIRGWNGTGRVAHSNGANVDVYRTFSVERGVNGTTAAQHASATAISRYVVPDDILYLTKQIATLMRNKARGGYAGKTGNAETGEVYYHDAFPRFELKNVREKYQVYE